jgi:putative redox protein
MQTQRLTFEGASGAMLSARLELPADEKPLACAVFAHCFTCSKNYKAVVNISRALAQAHVAVLRFDFTGLGESEGEFADTTFSSNVDDLVAAADFLAREYQAPSILIGHSLGGAAVLQAAHRVPSCRAVVTINAPAEPQHVKRHLRSSLDDIEKCGEAEVLLAGRTFTIKKQFLDDLNEQNMSDVIRGLERALLVFHSPDDAIVAVDNAHQLYESAAEPKSFVSLEGADHLLSRAEDSEYVLTRSRTERWWPGRAAPASPRRSSPPATRSLPTSRRPLGAPTRARHHSGFSWRLSAPARPSRYGCTPTAKNGRSRK